MTCHGVELDLLGMLDELGNHDRVVLAHVGGQLEEALQLLLIGADVHGSTGEHVARTYQDGEADTGDKLINVVHGGQCAPFRLIDMVACEHGGELRTVLCIVDVLG